jgi:hypothetical protein
MKDFSYNNLFIQLAIWFGEKKGRKDDLNTNIFYFESFNDANFKKYYCKLIDNVKKGKKDDFFLLEKIKERYDESKIKTDKSYDILIKLYFDQNNKRNYSINKLIRAINDSLILLNLNESKIDLTKIIIELNTKIEKLESDIALLKIKLLSLLKKDDLYTSYLVKIIKRHLSDMLIRKLIIKYPNNFEKITITHKNFYDILINYKDILFKSNNISIFNDLKNKLNINNIDIMNEKDRKKGIDSFINNIKDENEILIKEPIIINNEIISVNELNFLIETLFYEKSQGNAIVHPNIKSKEKIKLKDIKEEIPQTNGFSIVSNANNNYYFIEENELFNKDNENEIKKLITEKITNIKDELLKNFHESIIKENISIEDISKCILKNDYKNMYLINSAFTRGLSRDLDSFFIDYINNIVFESEEYDDVKKNIKNNKEILQELRIDQKELKKYQIEINSYIYRNIKNYCKNFLQENIKKNEQTGFFHSESNIIYIIKNLNRKISENFNNSNFDDCEIEALIISIILPEIIKIGNNNLNIYKKNLEESIKNFFVKKNVEKLLENTYNRIDIKLKENNNSSNLVDEVKKFIKDKKFAKSKELSSIDINEDKINDIILKIFGDDEYNWISEENTKIKLESLLFYHQNINS